MVHSLSIQWQYEKLMHWPLVGGLFNVWHSDEGTGWARTRLSLIAVRNVTARRQASVN